MSGFKGTTSILFLLLVIVPQMVIVPSQFVYSCCILKEDEGVINIKTCAQERERERDRRIRRNGRDLERTIMMDTRDEGKEQTVYV